ncbi:hypothetical protein SESBI_45101 [Sesbania bispinosa]|nr:hypothetical protein SESBI_45101 [Sesbania bispinosa]
MPALFCSLLSWQNKSFQGAVVGLLGGEAEEGERGGAEGVSEVFEELEGDAVKSVGTGLEGKWTILNEIVSRDYFEGF